MSVCLVTSSLFRYKLYFLARRADICDAAVSRPVVIRQRAPVACFPWLGLLFVSVLRHLLIIGNHVDAHESCVPSPFFPILLLAAPFAPVFLCDIRLFVWSCYTAHGLVESAVVPHITASSKPAIK